MQKFTDPVSGCAFHALQDVDRGKWPGVLISQWIEKQVHVVGHHYDSVKVDPGFPGGRGRGRPRHTRFAEAVFENQIASGLR